MPYFGDCGIGFAGLAIDEQMLEPATDHNQFEKIYKPWPYDSKFSIPSLIIEIAEQLRIFVQFPTLHQHQRPTFHPVSFFVPTPTCLRGFLRILADFVVSRDFPNSLIFSLFAPLFTLPIPAMHVRSSQIFIFLTI